MNKSKVKLISVALVSAIVGGSLIFILNNINGNNYVPTENRVFDNKQFDNVNIEDTLVFSHGSGFYDKEFLLQVHSENGSAKIYYTLDGSEPNTESYLYEDGIEIKDRKDDESVYSRIRDIADGFRPPSNVYKAMVVRCRAFKEDTPISEIITATYFVGDDAKDRYTLPIISLVSDPYNLFDYNHGIYVKGEYYDKLFDSSLEPWELEGNYTQRGREWEREVCIEYFDDGEAKFSQNVGIRIHGGATRSYPQKSLRFYARSEYGVEYIEYPVFGNKKIIEEGNVADRFKTLLLRNGGNDAQSTIFRDAMMQSLVEHTSLDVQAYKPVIVFLNGEYWGIHNIRERFDKYYFENYYGVSEEQLVLMEGDGELVEGTEEDVAYYRNMIDYIKNNSMKDSKHYQYISTLIDIENFILYNMAQIFFDNTDWPGNNNDFWRVRKESYDKDAPYGHDGRWRWLLYDTDFGFGLYPYYGGYRNNTLVHATKAGETEWPTPDWSTLIFRNLLENEEFKNQFINTFADYLNTSFKSEYINKRITEFKNLLEPEVDEHNSRWRAWPSWESNINVMIEFAEKRPDFQREHIISFFNLYGDSNINLDVSNKQHGYIRINSIDINEKTPGVEESVYPWTGRYFNGIPVSITAVPLDGYAFMGWEGDVSGSSQTIEVVLKEDIEIRAVFK
jgi:hypothetical protein